MFANTAREINGDAGIERIVGTSENVDMPDALHEIILRDRVPRRYGSAPRIPVRGTRAP